MGEEKIKILVVEDESSIRKFIVINLKREGYHVLEAETGEKALEIVKDQRPDVMVLDLMLPKMDGYEVCAKTRDLSPHMIIIMLTAKGLDMDKVMGLDLGADDYMVKPFNPLELGARIRANLRKANGNMAQMSTIEIGNLKLDVKGQILYKNNQLIELTPTEYLLVKYLMINQGSALSRDLILNEVWGKNYYGDMKTVDVHIRRLREKIEDNPSKPKLIETVWGHGYRLRGDMAE